MVFFFSQNNIGVHHKHLVTFFQSTLKIARCCPLVIQGFSNFLGLFQVIMANPEYPSGWKKNTDPKRNSWEM